MLTMVQSLTPRFKFLYASEKEKRTWLLFAGDACTRDTPVDGLDLPRVRSFPDPVGYQAERRGLQLAYSNQRQKDDQLDHAPANDTDLELKIERLLDQLAELRRAFEEWPPERSCRRPRLVRETCGLLLPLRVPRF